MITVVVTDWAVPFDQVVRGVHQFDNEASTVAFINAASLAWWQANNGDKCRAEYPDTEPYEPITELGYENARYELWGGEAGWHAMLDHATYAALNEAHYKRNYTDKGLDLPGYLIAAKAQGNWPK